MKTIHPLDWTAIGSLLVGLAALVNVGGFHEALAQLFSDQVATKIQAALVILGFLGSLIPRVIGAPSANPPLPAQPPEQKGS